MHFLCGHQLLGPQVYITWIISKFWQVLTLFTPLLSHWLPWNWKTAADGSVLPIHYTLSCAEMPLQAQDGQRRRRKEQLKGQRNLRLVPGLGFLGSDCLVLGFLFRVCCCCLLEKMFFGGRLYILSFPTLSRSTLILKFILWNLAMPPKCKSYCRFHEDSFKDQFYTSMIFLKAWHSPPCSTVATCS